MEGSLMREKAGPPAPHHQNQKTSWPEVVGMPATPAVAKIMGDRPDVAVEVLPPGTHLLPGANPLRVRVFINGLGTVAKVPHVG